MALLVGVVAWAVLSHNGDRAQALLLAERGDFAAAEPLLQAAWKSDPNDLEVVRALALGYRKADRPADAEPALTAWCSLRPDDPEPFRQRFAVRTRLGRKEQALEDGERLLELGPGSPDLARQVAAAFWKFGRERDAERAYRAAVALSPNHPELRYLLARSLHAQGSLAAAREVLTPLVRDYPTFPPGVRLLGTVERAEGRPAEAIPLLEKALTLDPFDTAARYELSLALGQVGREEEARRQLAEQQKIADADYQAEIARSLPDNLDLQVRAAQGLLDTGRGSQALPLLEEVLRRDPNRAAARRLLDAHRPTAGAPASPR
jgi:tetratricopeptide (TPR) repeat protein